MSGSSAGLEVVGGDELQQAPSGLRHLGALRQLGHAAEMPDRHGFDHVPLGDGVERLLDVGRIEQLEAFLQVVADLLREREHVAVARAVDGVAQVGAEPLHGRDRPERTVGDLGRAAHHLGDDQVAEVLRQSPS